MVMKRNLIGQILFPGICCVVLVERPGLVEHTIDFDCFLSVQDSIEAYDTTGCCKAYSLLFRCNMMESV
jgi:hypothetical protein